MQSKKFNAPMTFFREIKFESGCWFLPRRASIYCGDQVALDAGEVGDATPNPDSNISPGSFWFELGHWGFDVFCIAWPSTS